MSNLLRELKTSSLFQIPFFACIGALIFALAAWLLRHLCLTPWFFGALCLALASAGWASVHPLDHYLRHYRKLDLSISARFAFGSAVSISIFSVLLFFRLSSIPDLGCQRSSFIKPNLPTQPPEPTKEVPTALPERRPPLPPREDESYTKILEWREWHANLWNTMFLNQSFPGFHIGTIAEYTFDVSRNGQILNIDVQSDNPAFQEYVKSKISSLVGRDVLIFPVGSSRDMVTVKSNIKVCVQNNEDPRCGNPSEGISDDERIKVNR